jgi:hypothetical protein
MRACWSSGEDDAFAEEVDPAAEFGSSGQGEVEAFEAAGTTVLEGVPGPQVCSRMRLRAVAENTCWRWVFARPR